MTASTTTKCIIRWVIWLVFFIGGFLVPLIVKLPLLWYIGLAGVAILFTAVVFTFSVDIQEKWKDFWRRHQTWRTAFIAFLVPFLLQGFFLISQLIINNPPEIKKFYAMHNPVDPGEATTLKVVATDEEDDPITFQYEAHQGGDVPDGRVKSPEIQYTAPRETGDFEVTVRAFDGIKRCSAPPSRTLSVTVALGGTKAREYHEKGLEDLRNGRYDQAVISFNSVIESAPTFGDAYISRGSANAYLGKWSDAESDFTTYIQLQPDSAVGYLLRASAYQELGAAQNAAHDISVFRSKTDDPLLKKTVYGFESATEQERLIILNNAIKSSPNPYPYRWPEIRFPLPSPVGPPL
jgi:tetratricopeptide (TPR) repeat protein